MLQGIQLEVGHDLIDHFHRSEHEAVRSSYKMCSQTVAVTFVCSGIEQPRSASAKKIYMVLVTSEKIRISFHCKQYHFYLL